MEVCPGGSDERSGVVVAGPAALLDAGDQLLDAANAATSNRSLPDGPNPRSS
jgi:hypothetical protein